MSELPVDKNDHSAADAWINDPAARAKLRRDQSRQDKLAARERYSKERRAKEWADLGGNELDEAVSRRDASGLRLEEAENTLLDNYRSDFKKYNPGFQGGDVKLKFTALDLLVEYHSRRKELEDEIDELVERSTNAQTPLDRQRLSDRLSQTREKLQGLNDQWQEVGGLEVENAQSEYEAALIEVDDKELAVYESMEASGSADSDTTKDAPEEPTPSDAPSEEEPAPNDAPTEEPAPAPEPTESDSEQGDQGGTELPSYPEYGKQGSFPTRWVDVPSGEGDKHESEITGLDSPDYDSDNPNIALKPKYDRSRFNDRNIEIAFTNYGPSYNPATWPRYNEDLLGVQTGTNSYVEERRQEYIEALTGGYGPEILDSYVRGSKPGTWLNSRANQLRDRADVLTGSPQPLEEEAVRKMQEMFGQIHIIVRDELERVSQVALKALAPKDLQSYWVNWAGAVRPEVPFGNLAVELERLNLDPSVVLALIREGRAISSEHLQDGKRLSLEELSSKLIEAIDGDRVVPMRGIDAAREYDPAVFDEKLGQIIGILCADKWKEEDIVKLLARSEFAREMRLRFDQAGGQESDFYKRLYKNNDGDGGDLTERAAQIDKIDTPREKKPHSRLRRALGKAAGLRRESRQSIPESPDEIQDNNDQVVRALKSRQVGLIKQLNETLSPNALNRLYGQLGNITYADSKTHVMTTRGKGKPMFEPPIDSPRDKISDDLIEAISEALGQTEEPVDQ